MIDFNASRIKLHIAVALFGLTAILGKLLSLNAITLVMWRMLISLGFLIALKFLFSGKFKPLPKMDRLLFVAIGIVIGFHWFSFYGAVKISHVSVALICMALTPMFTSLIEPALLKVKRVKADLYLSVILIPLIYVLIGGIKDFNVNGFFLGLLASFLAAFFSVLNKKYLYKTDNDTLMLYEFSGVLLISLLFIPFLLKMNLITHIIPLNLYDWLWIFLLSILCTNLAFKLTVSAMQKISAFETNLIIGLEPVYGILLAMIIFSEHQYFNWQFYAASAAIIGIVFLYPLIRLKN